MDYTQELRELQDRLARATDSGEIDRISARIDAIGGSIDRTAKYRSASKAAAILAGVGDYDGDYHGQPFLKSLAAWKLQGDYEAMGAAKAVLGTSAATGQAILPSRFVADVVERVTALNPWRRILNVVPNVRGSGVDVPYEVTAIEAALLQGGATQAFGSNKAIVDFTLGTVTATLVTIAQIIDVGNQLLRQSEGAAESLVRSRLARSFALAEANLIVNGPGGANQTYGLVPAFGAFGGTAFDTTLSSEPRIATLGRAIGALETRGGQATAVVLSTTDYWEMSVEGLGTSYAGGWAMDPATGPMGTPSASVYGIAAYRDPTLAVGTGYVLDGSAAELYVGDEFRIDVSDQAGTRWDTNVTGFRAEESVAIDWRPAVFTGRVQRVLGL